MFQLNTKNKLSVKVKGLFQPSIPYEVRVQNGNWMPYFGHYQNQKWGAWDSNSCWFLSAINCVEDQLEWLSRNGAFSQNAMSFFTANEFVDSDGDFSLSERYGEVLGNNYDNGGTAPQAWQLMQKFGCIPRSMLTYSALQANQWATREAFVADYFNPNAVTPQMLAIGKQFLTYVNVAYQQIGDLWTTPELQILQAALRQAPLQIGVPVPKDVSQWNSTVVQYDGGKIPEHEIEFYNINPNNTFAIFDQYLPNLKILSKDYYIPFVHQGVVTAKIQNAPNPVPQSTLWNTVWTAVMAWFNRVKGMYEMKIVH